MILKRTKFKAASDMGSELPWRKVERTGSGITVGVSVSLADWPVVWLPWQRPLCPGGDA